MISYEIECYVERLLCIDIDFSQHSLSVKYLPSTRKLFVCITATKAIFVINKKY